MHKNNPDIVSDPLDAPAGDTRENARKKESAERAVDIASGPTAQGSTRGKIEETMMVTKAALMKKNVELQEMEGIEKQLSLMDRFKSSFVNTSATGQEEYDKAVREMLEEMPLMKKIRSTNKDGTSTSTVNGNG